MNGSGMVAGWVVLRWRTPIYRESLLKYHVGYFFKFVIIRDSINFLLPWVTMIPNKNTQDWIESPSNYFDINYLLTCHVSQTLSNMCKYLCNVIMSHNGLY